MVHWGAAGWAPALAGAGGVTGVGLMFRGSGSGPTLPIRRGSSANGTDKVAPPRRCEFVSLPRPW